MQGNIDIAMGTTTVPPAWSPEIQDSYRVTDWEIDVHTWTLGTTVEALRQGPVLAQRIGGEARTLVRQVDPNTLAHGLNVQTPAGNQ